MNLIEVIPQREFRLFLRYDDGKSGIVDLSSLAGRGVFSAWSTPGLFDKVRLTEAGVPEWPGGLDLCPDALYLQLTGSQPGDIFPALVTSQAHA
jgi:hypothetical protein